MASMRLKTIIFPEETEKTEEAKLREIPVTISGFQNIDVFSTESNVTITSNAEVTLTFTRTESKNIIIPDLTEPIRGNLKVDRDTPVVELRKLPIDEARTLILDYITEHRGAQTNDLIFGLGLDIDLVLGILKEFYENNEIEMLELQ